MQPHLISSGVGLCVIACLKDSRSNGTCTRGHCCCACAVREMNNLKGRRRPSCCTQGRMLYFLGR